VATKNRRRSTRNPTTIPTGKSEWPQRYEIDPLDPPTIREVISAYVESNAQARQPFNDDGDILPMASYTLAEIMREARPGNFLRYGHSTPRFRALKGQLRRYGQRTPLMIEIDRNGVAQVGEGNHRTLALFSMYGQDHPTPVRFVYNRYPINTHAGLTWQTADRDPAPAKSPRCRHRSSVRNGENVQIKVVDEGTGFTVWLHTDRQYDDDGELIYGKIEVEEPRRNVDKWCDRNVGKLEAKVRRSLDVLVAHNTRLHPSLWHRGLGLAMYVAALKHAAARPYPAAIIADACTGGTTSIAAVQTWERLRSVPGVIVAGTQGGIDDSMRTYAAFWVGV
jgi:hypothetical protein